MEHRAYRKHAHLLLVLFAIVCIITLVSTSFVQAGTPAASTPADSLARLQSSLTAEQQQALQAVLNRHETELAALAEQLGAAMPGSNIGTEIYLPLILNSGAEAVVTGNMQAYAAQLSLGKPNAGTLSATLAAVQPSLLSIQQDFEQELARILTADQQALYQEALNGVVTAEVTAASAPGLDQTVDAVACFNSAQWANYGFAYVTSAKAFAIMAAFNVDFGTNTDGAVQAYVSFNESESYALEGLKNLSTASVMITAQDTQVQNINGGTLFGVSGDAAMITAEDRNTLASAFALEDYLASGGTVVGNVGIGGNYFAYFAYAYGVIADFYLDETLVRTPACY